MNIHTRTVGNTHILDISGKIILGRETMIVRNTIKDLLANRAGKIVLNLAEVHYIDSSGVGELVSSFTSVAKEGGQLSLLNLTTKVEEILAITRLLTVFQVYESEEAAVAAPFDRKGADSQVPDLRMTASARAALARPI
jgi:anti-sigma B factor antagonist